MHCLDATKQGDWMTGTVMLCHDLGKSTTTTVDENGVIRSIGHEEASVPMTDDMLKRIHFTDHKTIGQIKMLVRLHMVGTREVISEKTIRKTLRQLMQCQLTYDHLVEVCRCDKSGRPPLTPFTPNIGQDRARQLIDNGDMIPVVTGKLLMAQGYDDYLNWGTYIDKALELQDKGILTIHNWKQRLKESGIKLPKGE
jgi:tRNA nucleotidyltransferase (CCA-adding enzyme)